MLDFLWLVMGVFLFILSLVAYWVILLGVIVVVGKCARALGYDDVPVTHVLLFLGAQLFIAILIAVMVQSLLGIDLLC